MPVYSQPHERKVDSLRVADLVAKVAKVSLKDTVRVLLSLDTVADFLDQSSEDILEMEHSVVKPTEKEAAYCSEAYGDLERYLAEMGIPERLDEIRSNR